MADPFLVEVMERASLWPPQDRAKLVAVARLIEAQHGAQDELTAEDWRIIDERVEAAERGAIASEPEVFNLFRKYSQS